MNEKRIHQVFVTSLVLKGLFAASELIGGIAVYAVTLLGSFASQQFLLDVAKLVTQEELSEDPRDFVANYLVHLAQTVSLSALHFAGLYLIVHGVIKLWLIVGLLRKKLWYYPTALVVFALFIVYQLYRYSFTYSMLLLFITAVDLVVIALTWHEYRYLRGIVSHGAEARP